MFLIIKLTAIKNLKLKLINFKVYFLKYKVPGRIKLNTNTTVITIFQNVFFSM